MGASSDGATLAFLQMACQCRLPPRIQLDFEPSSIFRGLVAAPPTGRGNLVSNWRLRITARCCYQTATNRSYQSQSHTQVGYVGERW